MFAVLLLLHLLADHIVDGLGLEGGEWNGRHLRQSDRAGGGEDRQDEQFLEQVDDQKKVLVLVQIGRQGKCLLAIVRSIRQLVQVSWKSGCECAIICDRTQSSVDWLKSIWALAYVNMSF